MNDDSLSGDAIRSRSARPRQVVCMGGGAAFGVGFHMGLTRALIDQGALAVDSPKMGLSAGAWAAAALATGVQLPQIAAAWKDSDRQARGLQRRQVLPAARAVFADRRHDSVTTVALRLPSGRRVLASGTRHTLAEAVAASASPWGMARGHELDGQRLYDPGTYYNTSADLAPTADTLFVLAPLSGATLGAQGRLWEHRLRLEVAGWRRRHRGKVIVVRPDRDVTALGGRRWRHIMDMDRAPDVEAASYEQGMRLAPALR